MTASDPTLDALARLDEPGAFIVRRDVPIFMEHEDTATGEKIGRKRLQELADINNRRTKEDGTPGSIVIGHTPGRKEEEIIHVGYQKNYRVARFGPKKKLGLLCDFYYKPELYSKAKHYPHRSIELWSDGIIDTVSVLARTPKLDLGLLLPDDGPVQQMQFAHVGNDGADLMCYSRGGSRRIYQMREDDPIMRLINELMAVLEKAKEQPEVYGMPSGTNTMVGDLITYSKEDHAKMLAEQAKLQKERDDAVKLYQKQGRQQTLSTLKQEGVLLDVDEELKDTETMNDEAFTKHVDKIKKCYQRSPVGGGFIPTEMPRTSTGTGEYNREAVRAYAMKHGVSIPAAMQAVAGGKA